MILASHGIIASQIASFDADAVAFFNRVTTAGGTLSTTEKQAVNQLVLDLKANSLWTPIKAIYPMVGASAAACAQNLKSSSFTGTFTSGWTFASTGATPNGTSAFMDTSLIPNNTLINNNNHLSVYLRTQDTSKSGFDIACQSGSFAQFFGLTAYYSAISTGTSIFGVYPTNSASAYSGSTRGFFTGTRTNSTLNKLYRNGSTIASNTVSNLTTLPTNPILVGSNTGPSEFQNRENSFTSIGDGLTDTQASNLYTAVQAFQTTLSRNV
jgi:hypothetical protein